MLYLLILLLPFVSGGFYCEQPLNDTNISEPNGNHNNFFYLYLIGYVLTTLVVIGCVGNLLTITLFNRRNLWARVNYYLIALAAWDIALLASAWLAFSLPTFIFYGQYKYHGSWIVSTYPFSYVVCNTAMVGCVWITVTLTVDRFMAVCYPLRHRTINSSTNAKVKIVVVSLLAILYGLPRAAELQLVDCMNQNNETVKMVQLNDEYKINSTFYIIYRVAGGLMFNSVGPFVVLLVLTCFMLKILSRAAAQRRVIGRSARSSNEPFSNSHCSTSRHKHSDNNSDRVNRLLMLVLAKFFLCYTLPTFIDIIQKFSSTQMINDMLFYLVEISNVLVVFHSTTNFFVYVCFGSKVKREFISLMKCESSAESYRLQNISEMSGYQASNAKNHSSRCSPDSKVYCPGSGSVFNGYNAMEHVPTDRLTVADIPWK